MNNNTKAPSVLSVRLILLLLILSMAIVSISVIWLSQGRSQLAAEPHAALVAPVAVASIPDGLNKESEILIGGPRHYTPTRDKAQTVRLAIMRGDFATAEKVMREALQQSKVGNWDFDPFTKLITKVPHPGNDAFLKHLDEWAAREGKSDMPYLLRALYYHLTGWMVRGGHFASDVQAEHLKLFREYNQRARADVLEAVRRDGRNPYSRYLWLRILMNEGDSRELQAAFANSIQSFPDYYSLYSVRLNSLSPKWGGSIRRMYAFVDKYAGVAGPHSPLMMLYVQLYADLLNTAAISCRQDGTVDMNDCVTHAMSQLVTENLETKVYAALQSYHHLDPYLFSIQIGSLLRPMVSISGGARNAGAVLQLAADTMGSDNQLVAVDTSKNNFMMDSLTALVWYRQGNYENAEIMYRRAITDIRNIRFPNDEERDLTLAQLYDYLAGLYNRIGQHEKVIIYQQAAEELGGKIRPDSSHLKCGSLYQLKLYDEAFKECTSQIEGGGDIQAAFWRAKTSEKKGQPDMAIRDYRLVADSEDYFRTAAAIDLSVVYARKNDLTHMLEVLNTYDFLYDEENQDKKDIAIAYNNRCYANMHLGKLKDALRDCTNSLRFDSLPDAFQKQQELIKRLKANNHGY